MEGTERERDGEGKETGEGKEKYVTANGGEYDS